MKQVCPPTYGQVDTLLEVLSKSKSMHILLVLDRKRRPIRFSELKKLVESSSTTISRRLKELETHGLVQRSQSRVSKSTYEYSLSEDAESLKPILQSLYDWANKRRY